MPTTESALRACAAPPACPDDVRWAAFRTRDGSADGTFVAAVRTTEIYCRPSCPARKPKRENVAFYDTGEDARHAGFRPCRRCRPDESGPDEARTAAVERACRLIESAESPPGLHALARAAGLSPFHFHRVFKSVTGVTPRAYAGARRAERAAANLREGASVTRAAYEAGYGASSRFYAEAPARLGMSPKTYRAGGPGEAIRFAVAGSALGMVLVAATERGVCAILLGEESDALVRDLRDRFPRAALTGGEPGFEALVARVVGLVERPGGGVDLPLDIVGTAFQQRVWGALRAIPPGTTASYAEVARAVGQPGAVRAVARACGANALAVAIPCHRVVRSDGALSGYRWGVARKRSLLAREGVRPDDGPDTAE